MKAPATGKFEGLANDFAACRLHLGVGVFQRGSVDHHQSSASLLSVRAGGLGFGVEPSAQTTVVEAGVGGTPVLKIPAEYGVIEAFGRFEVRRRELDVVHPKVMLLLCHAVILAQSAENWQPLRCRSKNTKGATMSRLPLVRICCATRYR